MLSPCSILSNNISIVSTLRKMLQKQVQHKKQEIIPPKPSTLSHLQSLKRQSTSIKSQLQELKTLVKSTTFETLIPEQYKYLLKPQTTKPEINLRTSIYEISFDDKQNRISNFDHRHHNSKSVHHTSHCSKQNHTLRSRIFKDLADLKKIEEKEKFIRDSSQIKNRKNVNTEYKRRPLEDILGINETRSVNNSHNNSRDDTFVTQQSLDSRIVESIITPIEESNIVVPALKKSNLGINAKSLLCGCKHEYYSGDVVNGKPHGKGRLYACCDQSTIKLSEGAQFYSGGFNEGKMEGYGTLTFKNGTKFVGMFKDGLRHGDGSIYYKGSVEMGKWSNGKLTNKM